MARVRESRATDARDVVILMARTTVDTLERFVLFTKTLTMLLVRKCVIATTTGLKIFVSKSDIARSRYRMLGMVGGSFQ